jgi:predicted HD phosphohydrolase
MNDAAATVDDVMALLQDAGGGLYFGEAVTKLEHAVQCAWYAQQADAGAARRRPRGCQAVSDRD